MARLFNRAGSDEFIERNTAAVTAAPFTVSAWVRGKSNNDMGFFWVGDKDDAREFWSMQLRDSTPSRVIRVRIRTAGTTVMLDTTAVWTENQWHHVGFVEASATDHRVFLDGANKVTSTTSIAPAGADRTSIGRVADSSPEMFFDGDIGHVAMWNVALTDAELATLANGTSPLRVRRDALIHYWPINGQSPEADVVGGLTLPINGTPDKSEEPPIPHSIVAPG